jgi:ankyrin repeat protein
MDPEDSVTAEQLGMGSFVTATKKTARTNPDMSPIRKEAVADHNDCKTIPPPNPTPCEVYAAGIEGPTFLLLNQPVPEIDIRTAPGTSPASPAYAEYINPDEPSTATQQMLKYVRTVTYQAGAIGEPDCGKVAPNKDQAALASFLKANAEIDARDPDCNGYTALHHAAATARMDIVHLLIAFGANIDRRDYDGNKAEDVAREAARDEVDTNRRQELLECMHCLIQGKQAKNRTRRFLDAGFLEYPM